MERISINADSFSIFSFKAPISRVKFVCSIFLF
jgi:hypothetical protein